MTCYPYRWLVVFCDVERILDARAAIFRLVIGRCAGIALVFLLTSCASGSGGQRQTEPGVSSEEMASPKPAATTNMVGVWQGTTRVTNCFGVEPGRCGAQQNVTLNVTAHAGANTEGYYKCSYGNQNCLGQNTSGQIVSILTNRENVAVRVVMPDTSSCLFLGRKIQDAIDGNYICYAGGAIREQGAWHARRLY